MSIEAYRYQYGIPYQCPSMCLVRRESIFLYVSLILILGNCLLKLPEEYFCMFEDPDILSKHVIAVNSDLSEVTHLVKFKYYFHRWSLYCRVILPANPFIPKYNKKTTCLYKKY